MGKRKDKRLRRRPPTHDPKRRFFIYCEGQKTEPGYFSALQVKYRDALVELKLIGAAGVPNTLATSAAEKANSIGVGKRSRTARSSFEERDQVWAVFDRDDHPHFDDAIARCTGSNVGVARSNPCFEVWLILHEQDFNRPDDRHAVQAHLRRLRPEYNPSGAKYLEFSELIENLHVAEERAAKMLERRSTEGDAHGRPSTTVHNLTRAISDAAALASLW